MEKPDPEEGVCWEVSISKAQHDLGYDPHFNVRDSIRAIYDEGDIV
jgi:nucleoside-diphosphate-sugar epimerase